MSNERDGSPPDGANEQFTHRSPECTERYEDLLAISLGADDLPLLSVVRDLDMIYNGKNSAPCLPYLAWMWKTLRCIH